MALFAKASEPPPREQGEEAFVLWIARELHGIPNATLDDAIDHDLHIYGDDLVHFVEKLEERYGAWVWEWPWQDHAELNEGLSLLFPFMLIWQLATWPFRGRFSYLSKKKRLTLDHIAFVLECGEWVDP